MVKKKPSGTQRLKPIDSGYIDEDSRRGTQPFRDTSDNQDETIPWVLEFRLAAGGEALRVQLTDVVTVGRGMGASTPDLDLTDHGALANGVSRRHAIVLARQKFLCIRDLNSTNGTFINGLRLMPGQDVPLEDGDLLRFGKLTAQMVFSVVPPNKLASANEVIPAQDPTDSQTVAAASLTTGAGHHLLVLEKDPEAAHMLREVLQRDGYRVTLVDDETEAAAVFAEERPAAAVLDLPLGAAAHGADGLDLLRLLRHRATAARANTPLILLAEDPSTTLKATVRRAGGTLVLPKPIIAADLVRLVGQVIRAANTPPSAGV